MRGGSGCKVAKRYRFYCIFLFIQLQFFFLSLKISTITRCSQNAFGKTNETVDTFRLCICSSRGFRTSYYIWKNYAENPEEQRRKFCIWWRIFISHSICSFEPTRVSESSQRTRSANRRCYQSLIRLFTFIFTIAI